MPAAFRVCVGGGARVASLYKEAAIGHWHFPLLGRRDIPGRLSSVELHEFVSLTGEKRAAIFRRRSPLNRLGVAVQIGPLRMTGQRPHAHGWVPPRVWEYPGSN